MKRSERQARERAWRRQRRRQALNKVFRGFGNSMFICLLLVLSALIFFLVQSRLAGGPPTVAGYQLFAVLSGSMNPAFDTGSLAVVKSVDPTELSPGDIITFGDRGGRMVTHRIVDMETEDGLHFVTKGDANNVQDSGNVPADRVVGVLAFAIPWLGRIMVFSQTKQGMLVLIIIPAFIILVLEARNLWKYAVQVDRAKKEAKQASQAIVQ